MNFYRATWVVFFLLGAAAIVGVLSSVNDWVVATALPGTEALCRGTFLGSVPLSRAPLCLALWVIEAKAWLSYAQGMVVHMPHAPSAQELMRTADVGLFAVGGLAVAAALNWLWATAMARVLQATLAGSYSLLHGLAHMLGRRAA